MNRELLFVKLGGSLVTDKGRARTARLEVIERLAREIVAARRSHPDVGLVVGHGSGSFGHPEAVAAGLDDGLGPPRDAGAVGRVQRAARELHGIVVAALADAGAAPFSLAPSSFMVSTDGAPDAVFAEPLLTALAGDLLPVVYGDVVLDRRRVAAIASTELVLTALVRCSLDAGHRLHSVLWLGDTDGVLDGGGDRIEAITPASWDDISAEIGGAGSPAEHDVTGGMRHRVETALSLAARGVTSWIADGRNAGVIGDLLASGTVPGTRVSDGD